jgi:hypothetical protein
MSLVNDTVSYEGFRNLYWNIMTIKDTSYKMTSENLQHRMVYRQTVKFTVQMLWVSPAEVLAQHTARRRPRMHGPLDSAWY